jgi:membrane-associated phospholipid phosphatase
MRRIACVLLLPTLGCWAPTHPGMSHFDAGVWGNAFATQLQRPDQLAIEAGLLVTTIALKGEDRQLENEATEKTPITKNSTANGDAVAVGLGVLAAGSSTAKWIGGDQGRDAEVLLESFILTDGITEILKHTVGRQRPADSSKDSFPSGHTSFAFSMATFLQRSWTDDHGGWAGYLAYAPALYVGIDRIESNKHWPTDVAFGAFLGVLLTNVVYDAHYGEAGRPGLFGVRGLSLEPAVGTENAEVSLVLRF